MRKQVASLQVGDKIRLDGEMRIVEKLSLGGIHDRGVLLDNGKLVCWARDMYIDIVPITKVTVKGDEIFRYDVEVLKSDESPNRVLISVNHNTSRVSVQALVEALSALGYDWEDSYDTPR